MSSTTRRGLIILAVLVVVTAVFCFWVPFVFFPAQGHAVALPVITVPGETLIEDFFGEGNPLTNTIVATILADIVVVIFVFLVWRASRGWTKEVPGRFQMVAELLGGFMYGMAKSNAGHRARWIFPLVASIFVFLLFVNWMKLIPGVESIGIMHCAHEGLSGYPKLGERLWVDAPLYSGEAATEADYEHCHHYEEAGRPEQAVLDSAADALAAEEAAIYAEYGFDASGNPLPEGEAEDLAAVTGLSLADRQALANEALEAARKEATEAVYEHAAFALTSDELRRGVEPYIFVVTPFVRGASTDLNLTIGLALISVVAVQFFGVKAQGPGYFQKFVNVNALATVNKRPLSAVDFLVGLFEIVSELGKIISLSFRLFGNLFAGGIFLAVIAFLVAALLPLIPYGLELIVTSVQAYVFAVLTLVFAAQAMEGHHGGDEEHHEEAH